MKYDFSKIEKKWQAKWRADGIYEPDLDKAKYPFYNLMMFPYPSAEGLHVGNFYAFTGSDIYGRFMRMQGNDVFEPMGLDGFGIHSENYAIKTNTHPFDLSKKSEKRFYEQLESTGNAFAWKEKLETYDPQYYRWTQWIFIQLFKNGLAYRKKAPVNWCPSCKTVLADEQVIGGKCERCGTVVEKKNLEQWFFRITKYADRLLKNLEHLDWSEKVKIAQKNWIGKSEGALIKFEIRNSKFETNPKSQILNSKHEIEVFTTRPDTIFGATYLVLSPSHSILETLKSEIKNWSAVEKYAKTALAKKKSELIEKEKTGVEIQGVRAINPATKKEIPIWVADYVLGDVGTGAIMAVPAHDERDAEFARKFKLAILSVIRRDGVRTRSILMGSDNISDSDLSRLGIEQVLPRNKEQRFLEIPDAKLAGYEKLIGEKMTAGFWNEYISKTKAVFIFKEKNGVLKRFELNPETDGEINILTSTYNNKPVPRGRSTCSWLLEVPFYRDLLIHGGQGTLINSEKFSGMDSEKAKKEITKFVGGKLETQYRVRDWLISRQRYWGPPIPMIYCEACAKANTGEQKEMPGWYAVPEKDLPVVLPYVKDFRPKGKGESPLATDKNFVNVKCPKCGAPARRETDVSDTFLDSAWYFFRYLNPQDNKEPFDKARVKRWLPVHMYIGGAEHSVLHLLYTRFLTMAFKDFGLIGFEEPFTRFRAHGLLIKDSAKMSKSKGNVVNPDFYIKEFGVDALRMYLMFLAPFEDGGDFQENGILGPVRLLERVHAYGMELKKAKPASTPQNILTLLNKTIQKITRDIETLHYNTAISALMILFNEIERVRQGIAIQDFGKLLKLLAPFAPHIVQELWSELGNNGYIDKQKWPIIEKGADFRESTFRLVIQVDGKVRDIIEVTTGISEKEALTVVFGSEKIKKFVQERSQVKNIIFVPDKIINLCLKQ